MATQGTTVVRAGLLTKEAVERLERRLFTAGLLSPERAKALVIVKASLDATLDFMQYEAVDQAAQAMTDTGLLRVIETALK